MARRKGQESQGAAVQASVIINEKKLKGLLKSRRSTTNQIGELTGAYRAELAQAVEKQNLHKKAYAMLTQFDKMEAEQALECWTHLTAYLDLSGVMEKINAVAKLPLEEAPESEEGVGGEPSFSLDERRRNRQQVAEAAE